MSTYDPEAEPAHSVPKKLEIKLVEAKGWYDACPSAAMSSPEERAEWSAKGVLLLMDVVEAVDDAWGYGRAFGSSE